MFLTSYFIENLYEFTVIPQFMSQLVPKKGDINQMMTQIEVREKTIFDDVNRNNVNRGNVVYSPTEVFLQK